VPSCRAPFLFMDIGMAKPYGLWKRGKTYYFRLPGGPWRSTGRTRQDEALQYILEQMEKAKQEAARRVREPRSSPPC
jgi:hypothetical protein